MFVHTLVVMFIGFGIGYGVATIDSYARAYAKAAREDIICEEEKKQKQGEEHND
jgi:hypothetical protein